MSLEDIENAIKEGSRNVGKLLDEKGVPYGVKNVDGKPRVSSMSYLDDIIKGNIPDHYPLRVLGKNPDVDAAREDLWAVGGLYIPPAAPQQMGQGQAADS